MDKLFEYRYIFHFESGEQLEFDIALDESLQLANPPQKDGLPEWTELDAQKCPNCTLDSSQEKYCPAAVGISGLLSQFKDFNSIEKIKVEVQTAERTYVKETDLQDGLFSIMGIIMPASGCPALSFLRPMARFHLPFSTIDETVIRSVSFFLLRKYFTGAPGTGFDQYLDELSANYETLQTVNDCLIERVRMMARAGDVNKNAVVILRVLSQVLVLETEDHLKGYEHLFAD